MSRHHERTIRRAQEAAASVGQREDTDPWPSARIESFVKGFGLSAAATRRLVDAWTADQQRARDAGWESHADSVYYDEW